MPGLPGMPGGMPGMIPGSMPSGGAGGIIAPSLFLGAAAGGFLGAVLVQVGLVGPVVKRLGETRTLTTGLIFAAIGWGGSAMTHSLPLFVFMLVPGPKA